MYLSGVVPWKSSHWTAPPPEEIARIRKEAGTHEAALAEEGDQIQVQGSRDAEAEKKDSLESGETSGEK
jgi:hypothetical protein